MVDSVERGNKAKQYFMDGYNCCQSIVAAYADVMKVDVSTAVKMASPFGGGMGRMREVCGAFSGILMVLGSLYGYDNSAEYDGKAELYNRVQSLATQFRIDNGSIVCRQLLGIEGKDNVATPSKRTDEYYKKRPCPELVAYSAKLIGDFINENE